MSSDFEMSILDTVAYHLYSNGVLEQSVLKGGYLLSKLGGDRHTRDIDLSIDAELSVDDLLDKFKDCGEDMIATGFAVNYKLLDPKLGSSGRFTVVLADGENTVHVDFSLQKLGFGVHSAVIRLNNLQFDMPILCYSYERILSDKIQALNTIRQFRRLKDLYDIYSIISSQTLSHNELCECMLYRDLTSEVVTGIIHADPKIAEFSIFREEASKDLQHAWDRLSIKRRSSSDNVFAVSKPNLNDVLDLYRIFLNGYVNSTSSFVDSIWNFEQQQWV